MIADHSHTTAGASDSAQLHMLRAVETGIINVILLSHSRRLGTKSFFKSFFLAALLVSARVRRKVEATSRYVLNVHQLLDTRGFCNLDVPG